MVLPYDNNNIAMTFGDDKESLLMKVEQAFNLTSTVKKAYQNDKLYSQIFEKLEAHTTFTCKDRLISTKNLLKWEVLCIPHGVFQKGGK